jgi:hypothetical protein
MAWYDTEHSLRHTEIYANAEVAAKDAARALAAGWQLETEGPTRNPRALPTYALLVPFDTGNRQPGEVECTFVRTPEWLEQHRKS